MSQLSDEILIAYADGEMIPSQAGAVEQVLAADPATQQRMEMLEFGHEQLAKCFQDMLLAEQTRRRAGARPEYVRAAPTPTPQAASEPSRSRGRGWRRMLHGFILLGVGGMAGFYAASLSAPVADYEDVPRKIASLEEKGAAASRPADVAPERTAGLGHGDKNWPRKLAQSHPALMRELRQMTRGQRANPELLRFELSRRLQAQLSVPALDRNGLALAGGRALSAPNDHILQFLYRETRGDNGPLALYVFDGGREGPVMRGREGEVNYVNWSDGLRSYLLAGPQQEWRLIVLSVAVRRQFEAMDEAAGG